MVNRTLILPTGYNILIDQLKGPLLGRKKVRVVPNNIELS